MIASWIAETVRAFGRSLGLKDFALNERGAAGVRFENGRGLYLEGGDAGLMVSVGVPSDPSAETMKRLLARAHYAARTDGLRVRAVWVEKAGEARFVTRVDARDLTATSLEQAFRALWQEAEVFGRAAS